MQIRQSVYALSLLLLIGASADLRAEGDSSGPAITINAPADPQDSGNRAPESGDSSKPQPASAEAAPVASAPVFDEAAMAAEIKAAGNLDQKSLKFSRIVKANLATIEPEAVVRLAALVPRNLVWSDKHPMNMKAATLIEFAHTQALRISESQAQHVNAAVPAGRDYDYSREILMGAYQAKRAEARVTTAVTKPAPAAIAVSPVSSPSGPVEIKAPSDPKGSEPRPITAAASAPKESSPSSSDGPPAVSSGSEVYNKPMVAAESSAPQAASGSAESAPEVARTVASSSPVEVKPPAVPSGVAASSGPVEIQSPPTSSGSTGSAASTGSTASSSDGPAKIESPASPSLSGQAAEPAKALTPEERQLEQIKQLSLTDWDAKDTSVAKKSVASLHQIKPLSDKVRIARLTALSKSLVSQQTDVRVATADTLIKIALAETDATTSRILMTKLVPWDNQYVQVALRSLRPVEVTRPTEQELEKVISVLRVMESSHPNKDARAQAGEVLSAIHNEMNNARVNGMNNSEGPCDIIFVRVMGL